MRIASPAVVAVLLTVLFCLPGLTGCSSLPVKSQEQAEIAPSKAHEDCFEMKKGDTLAYSFQASKPLDFNLHCHEGSEIICPIDKKGVASGSGAFVADRDQYFCLMWTNPHKEAASVKYTYSLEKKK